MVYALFPQQGGSGGALSVLQKLASADVKEVAITGESTVNEIPERKAH